MVSIVVRYREGDDHDFKRCWHPLIYKHGEMDFIMIGENIPLPDKGNVRTVPTNLDAFNISQDTMFYTTVNAIPTYETMILLQEIDGKNVRIKPKWLNPSTDELTVMSDYKKADGGCEVIEKGTMYNIREML